jgi:hypothetical protein
VLRIRNRHDHRLEAGADCDSDGVPDIYETSGPHA